MDYQQSRAYIRDAEQYAGGAMDLTNIKELMKRLGNPQDQLKYIHVAGTNGKGSVIAYLYTTLMKAGYLLKDGIGLRHDAGTCGHAVDDCKCI